MSGFAGILRLDGAPVDASELERMAAPLVQHGPDAAGFWREGPLGLTHRLLRITPEDAREAQPLVSPEAALVFNGRLDYREDLLEGLGRPDLKPAPDSALVLAAWHRWGEDCVARLEGDYSFVLYDRGRRRLFAAVDAAGLRTLFYHHRAPWFLFATVPTALLAHPHCPRELDPATVAGYLALRRPYAGETFFQDIRQLPPAHTLALDVGAFSLPSPPAQLRRYWQAPPPYSLRLARDEDYPEVLRELLDRAVASRLRSAHPIGATLSGGLDSSSVAWMAARQLDRRGETLATYTAIPGAGLACATTPHRYADETPLVLAQAARQSNLRPRFIQDSRPHLLTDLPRWFEAGGLPQHGVHNRTWMETLVEQAHADGVRVLLTGQGGNSSISFSGAGRRQELMRHGLWRDLWREADLPGRLLRADWGRLARRGLMLLGPRPIHPGPRWRNSDALNPAALPLVQSWSVPDARRGQALRLYGLLSLSETHDGALQALTGVELRDPTRDRRVLEFCLALPWDQFVRDGASRRLIRRAMAERLPPEVLHNPYRGQQAADWAARLEILRPQLPALLERMATDPEAARLIHLDLLRERVAHWPRGGWADRPIIKHYQGALGRGLMAGEFILWLHALTVHDRSVAPAHETRISPSPHPNPLPGGERVRVRGCISR